MTTIWLNHNINDTYSHYHLEYYHGLGVGRKLMKQGSLE